MNERIQLYKPAQGMVARGVAGVLVFLFALYGCWSLYDYPSTDGWWGHSLLAVDALDIDVTLGFLISGLVAVLCAGATYLFVVNHPKSADFLAETEAELKKVSWPTRQEYMSSSFVVILSVVILSVYLVFADTVIGYVLSKLGY